MISRLELTCAPAGLKPSSEYFSPPAKKHWTGQRAPRHHTHHAQDEQEVGQDGAKKRALHDTQLALDQRDDGAGPSDGSWDLNAHDELDQVTQGRVHEPAEGLSNAHGQLLGREAE